MAEPESGSGRLSVASQPLELAKCFKGRRSIASRNEGLPVIFNDSNGVFGENDAKALVKWLSLLAALPAPSGGELPARDDFPTRFPVGLGNSDAHEVGLIGSTFTYCRLAGITRDAVMDALVHGRCVASNGPLAFASVNGTGTGDVALVNDSANTVEITIQTTAEFGPAGD